VIDFGVFAFKNPMPYILRELSSYGDMVPDFLVAGCFGHELRILSVVTTSGLQLGDGEGDAQCPVQGSEFPLPQVPFGFPGAGSLGDSAQASSPLNPSPELLRVLRQAGYTISR
jgi:hypothetical protein